MTEAEPGQINIPVILLSNVSLRVDTLPGGERMLMIGPVALALPLDEGVEKWLSEQIRGSGIVIARPDQLPVQLM